MFSMYAYQLAQAKYVHEGSGKLYVGAISFVLKRFARFSPKSPSSTATVRYLPPPSALNDMTLRDVWDEVGGMLYGR